MFFAVLGSHLGDMSGFFFGKKLGPPILGTKFIKKREKNINKPIYTDENSPKILSAIRGKKISDIVLKRETK